MRDHLKQALEYTRPQYNELITFLTALICIVLFCIHPDFRTVYFDILTGAKAGKASIGFIGLGVLATFGFFLSIFHVLTKQEKSKFEKVCMGVFIMSVNGLAGIVSGTEIISSQSTTLLFFPLWNIASGAILLYQIGLQRFDVSDENASPIEVVCGSLLLILIYVLLKKAFVLSWAMTFSICMFSISLVLFIYSWGKYFLIRKK